MQKTFVLIAIAVVLGFSLRSCSSSEVTLSSQGSIEIPSNTQYVEVKQDGNVFTLKREKVISDKKHMVEQVSSLFWKQPTEPSLLTSCTGGYFMIPLDKEMEEFLSYFKGGRPEIRVTDENKDKVGKILKVSKKFNATSFSAAILPANDEVRSVAKSIKKGDTVVVTGVLFSQTAKEIDGKKAKLSSCAINTKIFYVEDLEIE